MRKTVVSDGYPTTGSRRRRLRRRPKERQRLFVGAPPAQTLKRSLEYAVGVGRGGSEEGHRGSEFHIVGRAENRVERTIRDGYYPLGAENETRPEFRMRQVGPRLIQRCETVKLCRGRTTQTTELWKDEPDPVRPF